MITETSGKNELLTAIEEEISQLLDLISSLDENKINTVPYEDSWTAGQLSRLAAACEEEITGVVRGGAV